MWGGGGTCLFGDRLFHLARIVAQLGVSRFQQPIVKAANMLDRTQARSRHAELETLFKAVRQQGDILQVGQEGTLGLVVGVAHIVAYHAALARQFANARHLVIPINLRVAGNQ
jgi:hypothetical protein